MRTVAVGLKHLYYVEGYGGWFAVKTENARKARQCGVHEFGRGRVSTVRQATQAEIDSYVAQRGELQEE